MFDVEVTYRTMLGGLNATMTTTETVATREEADQVREILSTLPGLEGARIRILRSKGAPTVDEVVTRFTVKLAEYRPLQPAS